MLLFPAVKVRLKSLSCLLAEKYLSCPGLALSFHVTEVFANVLVAIQAQQLRNSKARVKEKEKDCLVPEWLLMMSGFESQELLGRPLEGYHLIIRKALPGRLVSDKFIDSLAGVASETPDAPESSRQSGVRSKRCG